MSFCALHHESVFPGGQGHEDPLYPDRGAACHAGRDGGKCGAGGVDGVGKEEDDTSFFATRVIFLTSNAEI